jgi:drug/metabolite transporter (DMT)-like permease
VIYGLGAALGWGVADFGAALSSRRIGPFRTVVITQLSGLAAIAIVAILVRPEWTGSATELWLLVANGAIVAAAYAIHYRALELGPIALVSPLTAGYALVPIMMATLLLDESLTAALVAGAALTIVGVVLITFDPRDLGDVGAKRRTGVPYAFASMLLFGLATFVLGRGAQEVGWLPAVGLGRLFTVAALVPFVAIGLGRSNARTRGVVWAAVLVGIVDMVGIVSFSRGAELGLISLVAAVSATFPLIPFVGGIAVLGERPARSQGLGVLLVVAGLVVLGIAA